MVRRAPFVQSDFEVIMNLYDLSQYNPALYEWNPAALRQVSRANRRIFVCACFAAAAVATLLLAFASRLRGTEAAYFAFAGSCLVLFLLGAAAAADVLWQRISMRRIAEDDPAAAHDCAYFLYTHGRLHTAAQQSMAFLSMAAAALRLGRIRQAEQALYGVQAAYLPKTGRPLWQYLCCVCALADGQEDAFASGYAALQAMPLYGQTPPERAAFLEVLQSRTLSACGALLGQRKHHSRRSMFYAVLRALGWVWALFTLLYMAAKTLLPHGLAFRAWVSLGGALTIWCGAGILLLVLFGYGICVLAATGASEVKADILRACGTLLALLASGVLLLGCWWIQGNADSETLEKDGTLQVETHSFWNSDSFSCEAAGPFFRRTISPALQPEPAPPDSEASAGSAPLDTEGTVQNGYRALLAANFAADAPSAHFTASAKGVPYVIVRQNEDTLVRLVYDRVSANGTCLLYVCYEDTLITDAQGGVSAGDTTILNFYAYNPTTGETIAADKTSWSGTGSEAYRSATGE